MEKLLDKLGEQDEAIEHHRSKLDSWDTWWTNYSWSAEAANNKVQQVQEAMNQQVQDQEAKIQHLQWELDRWKNWWNKMNAAEMKSDAM